MVSRLQVIRHMLSVIGESGISNQDSLHPSVLTAKSILDTEDLDFQGPGWWFNKEYRMTLAKDIRGEVQLPAGTLDMKISNVQDIAPSEKNRYVKRGNRIYDAVEHTFEIGQSLVVDITRQLEIEDLPAVAGSYLMHRAGLAMYVDDDGDQYKTDKLERRVTDAWQKLRSAEMSALAVNALDSPVAQRMRMSGSSSYNPSLIGGRVR